MFVYNPIVPKNGPVYRQPVITKCMQRLLELGKLESGWLGPEAGPSLPIKDTNISWTAYFLTLLNDTGASLPSIYGTPGGGLSMEWNDAIWSFDIEVDLAVNSIQLSYFKFSDKEAIVIYRQLDMSLRLMLLEVNTIVALMKQLDEHKCH
jgi:hypothetical protein